MNEAQKYLIENRLDDRVISKEKETSIYVSDAMMQFKGKQACSHSELKDGLDAPVCCEHKDRKATYIKESFLVGRKDIYICDECEKEMLPVIKRLLNIRGI